MHIVPIAMMIVFSTGMFAQTECDVSVVYDGIGVDRGVKVLTTDEEIEELGDIVELILEESKLDEGYYEVSITRKGQDLYKIDGTSVYVQTRYCYEYSYGEDVILHISSNYGHTRGEITWP